MSAPMNWTRVAKMAGAVAIPKGGGTIAPHEKNNPAGAKRMQLAKLDGVRTARRIAAGTMPEGSVKERAKKWTYAIGAFWHGFHFERMRQGKGTPEAYRRGQATKRARRDGLKEMAA
jgi:hypothetical protein